MAANYLKSNYVPTLHYETQCEIHFVRNPVTDLKMKHIALLYHHIEELPMDERLKIRKFDIKLNIVDFLRKSLLEEHFKALTRQMELHRVIE